MARDRVCAQARVAYSDWGSRAVVARTGAHSVVRWGTSLGAEKGRM